MRTPLKVAGESLGQGAGQEAHDIEDADGVVVGRVTVTKSRSWRARAVNPVTGLGAAGVGTTKEEAVDLLNQVLDAQR